MRENTQDKQFFIKGGIRKNAQWNNFFKEENIDNGIKMEKVLNSFDKFKTLCAYLSKKTKKITIQKTIHAFKEENPFERINKSVVFRIQFQEPSLKFYKKMLEKEAISIDEFNKVVKKEKKISGEIIDYWSFRNEYHEKVGIFFVTTNGVAYIIEDGTGMNYGGMGALSAIGPVGAIFGTMGQGVYNSIKVKKLNKEQRTMLDRAKKYSTSLATKCYKEGIFIPFDKINEMIYSKKKKAMSIRFGDEYARKFYFNVDDLIKMELIFKSSNLSS